MSQDQPEQQTLGALFADASRDLSLLVHSEIELAKTEIRRDVKNGVAGGAMFGAAAFVAVLAVIMLSVAAAYGLVAAGLHPGWAFLVVAGAYLLLGLVLAFAGKSMVAKVGPPKRTIRTSKDTAAFLKHPRASNADTSIKT